MDYADLYRRMNDQPFKPFRIKMLNNSTYDVLGPWMLIAGETSAVVVTHTRRDDKGFVVAEDWRTIAIDHITEFSDIAPKKDGSKR